MAKKIAFINGKGGCGKTTSIFHVAGVLSKLSEKVLVIDVDKQCNTSDTLLYNTQMPEKTVLDFMKGSATAEEVTQQALFQSRGNANAKYYNVDCMISDIFLKDEKTLEEIDGKAFGNSLNAFIEKHGYTWVLIDMPPSNEALNNICFSYVVDYVIVPFSSDVFSVKGYDHIISTINEARKANPSLNILGVYLARYMMNCMVDKYIRSQMLKFDTFIDVQIPLAADARESIMFGRPLSFYKEKSKTTKAYEKLVNEMIKRMNKFKKMK